MSKNNDIEIRAKALAYIADPSVPKRIRQEVLQNVMTDSSMHELIVDSIEQGNSQSTYQEKARELSQILQQLHVGPLQRSTFIGIQPTTDNPMTDFRRIWVSTSEGLMSVMVPEKDITQFQIGDQLFLDRKGTAILGKCSNPAGLIGDAVTFVKQVNEYSIEVLLRNDDHAIMICVPGLHEPLRSGKMTAGTTLWADLKTYTVHGILQQKSDSNNRFLHQGPLPDVRLDRDVGSPHPCIARILRHIEIELRQPQLHRRYGIPSSLLVLLTGCSGSGKTFACEAVIRGAYELMANVSGLPVEDIAAQAPRIVRIRPATVLNKWLGQTEANIEAVCDAVEAISAQSFITPKGVKLRLPVMVVLEEIDGIGQQRGHDHDGIHDRILTTWLQRLDPQRSSFRDQPVIWLATTNTPELVDPALMRRIGGSIEFFGRLNRHGFSSVLLKKVMSLPAASNNGHTQQEIWEKNVEILSNLLYSPNTNEKGMIEVLYAGSTTPEVKHARHFMTPAIIAKAVNNAAAYAVQEELHGISSGVGLNTLARCLYEQVLQSVQTLGESNAHHHFDVPQGKRVASIKRIPQPKNQNFDFLDNPIDKKDIA